MSLFTLLGIHGSSPLKRLHIGRLTPTRPIAPKSILRDDPAHLLMNSQPFRRGNPRQTSGVTFVDHQKRKKPANLLASLQISKSKVNNGSGNAGCPPPEDGPRRTPLAATAQAACATRLSVRRE
jgi:hypothetical protein